MSLVRLNPWREIDTLQRRMNRMFEDALSPVSFDDFAGFANVPAAELSETDEAVHLKLEIPGIDAKDLNIEVTADTVSISGERKSEEKSETDGVKRTEFRYGKFQRAISLPSRIQNTEVKADYKDGILHLTLPKAEEEKNKIVKVNIGDVTA
ncbi:Hsp20/alpha crystallin family protein [Almyronema epifaneia]|uniref:Hsp20/alpha crystallin family protein n=1 Tax=Almyronema epifaneia S1 TaxID=2991925 RepID=A0ABW6IFR2_9CYAN